MIALVVTLIIVSFFSFVCFNLDMLEKIYRHSNAVFFIYFILGLVTLATKNKDMLAVFIAFIIYLAIRILYYKYTKKDG